MKVLLQNDGTVFVFHYDDDDGREPEIMTIDEFTATYGEDSLPIVVEAEVISHEDYWLLAIDLIDAWAKYQAKKKLCINAQHKETAGKVANVVQKYGGTIEAIGEQRDRLSKIVDERVYMFEQACSFFRISSVDRSWLFNNLREAKDYRNYRRKCRRRLKCNEIAAPLEYI